MGSARPGPEARSQSVPIRSDDTFARLQEVERRQDELGLRMARVVADIFDLKANLAVVRERTLGQSLPSSPLKAQMDQIVDDLDGLKSLSDLACLKALEARIDQAEQGHKNLSMRMEQLECSAHQRNAESSPWQELTSSMSSQIRQISLDLEGFKALSIKACFDGLEARIAQAELGHDHLLMRIEDEELLGQKVQQMVRSQAESQVDQIMVVLDVLKAMSTMDDSTERTPNNSPQKLANDLRLQLEQIVINVDLFRETSAAALSENNANQIEQAEVSKQLPFISYREENPNQTDHNILASAHALHLTTQQALNRNSPAKPLGDQIADSPFEVANASPRAEAANGSAAEQELQDACPEEKDPQSRCATRTSETTLDSSHADEDVPLNSDGNKVMLQNLLQTPTVAETADGATKPGSFTPPIVPLLPLWKIPPREDANVVDLKIAPTTKSKNELRRILGNCASPCLPLQTIGLLGSRQATKEDSGRNALSPATSPERQMSGSTLEGNTKCAPPDEISKGPGQSVATAGVI